MTAQSAPMTPTDALLTLFAQPPREYGPIALWLWNDALEPSVLTRELELMTQNGVFAAIIQPGNGIRTAPGSPTWFQRIGYALQEARRLGMQIWIHTDYPERVAVPRFGGPPQPPARPDPRLLAQHLVRAQDPLERLEDWRPALEAAEWPDGERMAALLAHAGSGEIVDLTPYLDAESGEPEIPASDPSGWTLNLFACGPRPLRSEYSFDYDPLSLEATEACLRTRLLPYQDIIADFTGDTLRGFVLGDPAVFEPRPARTAAGQAEYGAPWTHDLLVEFSRRKGYDLRSRLMALWDETPGASHVRMDYYEVLGELLIHTHYDPLRSWCEAHNAALAMLPGTSGSLARQALSLIHPLTVLRVVDVPGSAFGLSDALNRRAGDHFAGTHAAEVEMAAYVAISPPLDDIPHYEAFGMVGAGRGWGQTLRDLQAQAESCLISGLNDIVLHAFVLSLENDVEHDTPPSLFFQNTFWPMFGVYALRQRRLTFALGQGIGGADVGVYYPFRAPWEALPPGCTQRNRLPESGEAWRRLCRTQTLYHNTYELLRSGQWELAALDDQAILNAEVEDGELIVGGDHLRAVVLPDVRIMPSRVAQRLMRFVETGGLVVTLGQAPSEGVTGDAGAVSVLEALFSAETEMKRGCRSAALGAGLVAHVVEGVGPLKAVLSERFPARIRLQRRDVRIRSTHRKANGFDLFMLTCPPNRTELVQLISFQAQGVPVQLDPETGALHRLIIAPSVATGWITVPVDLTSGVALVAIIRDPIGVPLTAPERTTRIAEWTLAQHWVVSIDNASMPSDLAPWAEMGSPHFSGAAQYVTMFRVPTKQEMNYDRLILDLGEVHEWAQVWINGVRVGQRIAPPFHFDVTQFVGQGDNELQITVGNTPANAQLNEERISGLIGPVSIAAFVVRH